MVYPVPPENPSPKRFPKVPLDRRAYAFGIDFIVAWFLASFVSNSLFGQFLVFLLVWFITRVIVVVQNRGQSLGRWALDMKVIDTRWQRIPGMVELSKREAIVGGAAALLMVGAKVAFVNPLTLILLASPLLADCGMAIGDEAFYQAFHDRIGGTFVIQTRRGFSLDLRLKRLWYEVKRKIDRS
jgi:RDD family